MTGIFNLSVGLLAKRIEMMHQVVPNAGSIAVLINHANPNAEMLVSEAQGIQAQLGITTPILRASTLDEISAAFAAAVRKPRPAHWCLGPTLSSTVRLLKLPAWLRATTCLCVVSFLI